MQAPTVCEIVCASLQTETFWLRPRLAIAHGRLITALELLRYQADAFARICGIIGQSLAALEGRPSVPTDFHAIIGGAMGELQLNCEKLELTSCVQQLKRIYEYTFNNDAGVRSEEMARLFRELQARIADELETRYFVAIPFNKAAYYEPKEPLFGKDVEQKFPLLSGDIAEAGKCLALGRYTAAVFHLMRVMEAALRELGTILGVSLVNLKNWQNILDEVNKAIKALNPHDAKTQALAAAAAHLFNVKLAWRNQVMHPKDTYTEEEAEAVFRGVKTFVSDLVTVI